VRSSPSAARSCSERRARWICSAFASRFRWRPARASAAAIFGSFYKVPSPTILAPWYALIWGAIGLILMFAVKGREPASDALADLRTSA